MNWITIVTAVLGAILGFLLGYHNSKKAYAKKVAESEKQVETDETPTSGNKS